MTGGCGAPISVQPERLNVSLGVRSTVMIRYGWLLVAFLVFCAPASAAPSPVKKLRQQVERLQDERDNARDSRASWRSKARTNRSQARTYRGERDEARAQLATSQAQVAQLTPVANMVPGLQAENASMRSGLPSAITAVPLDQFWELVFTPARQRWPCDSMYSSGGYWSLTFDSTSFC